MLLLKLKKISQNTVVYDYFPEKKEDYGTLEFDLNTDEIKMIKRTEQYKQSMYLMHAYQGLMRMKEEGDFSESRIVAWY